MIFGAIAAGLSAAGLSAAGLIAAEQVFDELADCLVGIQWIVISSEDRGQHGTDELFPIALGDMPQMLGPLAPVAENIAERPKELVIAGNGGSRLRKRIQLGQLLQLNDRLLSDLHVLDAERLVAVGSHYFSVFTFFFLNASRQVLVNGGQAGSSRMAKARSSSW